MATTIHAALARRLRLYVLTDAGAARGRPLADLVAAALDGGATAIQLRDTTLTTRALVALGHELRRVTRAVGALLIVNDRVDVACAIAADGVHLGQDDLPAPVARALLGPQAIIGGSAGDAAELRRALAGGVDYLGIGPMYPTTTKADAGPAIGPAALAALRPMTAVPIIGVGSVTASNVAPVIAAGADGAAVISSVLGADDVRVAAQRLRQAIDRVLVIRHGVGVLHE